ncbi:MAG: hypothetical protein Q4B26_07010 [Eubacteriales bacterium]|nr:hypothetical protein [Eubacteriales bacterium]
MSDEEFLVLIQFIQQLKENGATIILIGYYHFTLASKVDSLALISDQMTLLQRDRSFFDITDLQIIGRMQLKYTDSEDRTETALKVQGLESQFLQDVRFSAHSKEITNIYYSKHSAALELYNVISGKEQEYDGELYLSGRMLVSKTVYDRVKEGIFGIAECGRPEEFLLDNLSAWQNYVLLKGSSLREVWWKKRYQTYLSEEMDREIGRKITDKYPWEMTAWEASSIRLMAFMLARPKVLICLDPYSGVDKVTSERINKWLIRIAEKGAAVIVISRQQNLSGINYYLTEKGTMVRVKNS